AGDPTGSGATTAPRVRPGGRRREKALRACRTAMRRARLVPKTCLFAGFGIAVMTTIGFYAARTRLSELLDEVARGKKILITRRGKPAAVLGPAPARGEPDIQEVIAALKELRRGNRLGTDLSVRDLIEEGRRF